MRTNKYHVITGVYGYPYGIFRGDATLESNGRRYRARWDAVRWEGSTGAPHRYTEYLSLADGRKRLRAIRKARVAELKGVYLGYTSLDVIADR